MKCRQAKSLEDQQKCDDCGPACIAKDIITEEGFCGLGHDEE